MRVEFTLYSKMQSGKNRVMITRTGHRYPTERFVEWRGNMERQIAAQIAAIRTFTTPVRAIVRYTPGDLIRRDAPGIIDALWHVLERTRIVADDALIQAIDYHQEPIDRANPRCLIVLEPR